MPESVSRQHNEQLSQSPDLHDSYFCYLGGPSEESVFLRVPHFDTFSDYKMNLKFGYVYNLNIKGK